MSGLQTVSKSDWDRVRLESQEGIPPDEDTDSPNVAHLMRLEVEQLKRGRVPGSGVKSSQNLRLDTAVLEAFKATGKGWQTRINDALRTYLNEHPLSSS